MTPTLPPATVRARVAEAIRVVLEPQGWALSTFVPQRFGRDPRALAHHAYAVGLVETVAVAGQRQARVGSYGRAVEVVSRVVVRYAHLLRAASEVADYDEALEAERQLAAAVLDTPADRGLTLRFEQVSRATVGGDGTYHLGTLEFSARFRMSLEVVEPV